MAAAAQDHKDMGGGIFSAMFGDSGILGDCKSAKELINQVSCLYL